MDNQQHTYQSTTQSTQSTIKILQEATESLTIHNEIQSILNSIITDIEIKNDLESYINHQLEMKQLRMKCHYAEMALEEYKMLEREREEKNKGLVDDFVNDICRLNYLLDELQLQSVKQQHINNVNSHNDVSDEANQERQENVIPETNMETHTDEQITTFKNAQEERKDVVTKKDNIVSSHINDKSEGKEAIITDTVTIASVDAIADQNMETNNVHVIHKESTDVQPATPTNNDQLEDTINAAVTKEGATPITLNTETSKPQGVIVATTTKKSPKKRTKIVKKTIKRILPPTLQSLNSTILMSIFEYMDAIDIVNLAQTNVLMYSKVDTIFGLGGAGFDADGRDAGADLAYEECSIEEEIEVEVDVEDDYSDHDDIVDSNLSRPTSNQSFSSSGASVDQHQQQQQQQPHATIVSLPPSTSTTTLSVAENSTSKSNETVVQTPKIQNLTGRKSSENSLSNIANTETVTQTTSTPSSTGGFQLSSAVASALADKLSPMELSAIITMREQLRTRELEMTQMRDEFKTLNAKFEGTMSVNEVLTVQVKEQQLALDQNKSITAKMNRQMSSDQEVIAFLDERVQELERHVDNFDNERAALRNEMDKIKKASEKQLSVLGDMLTFEREQVADNEKEWKTAKKLLVKEVKHCRAQILALEAERDGYCEENAKLKEALLSIGSISKSNKSFDLGLS